ncbi:MAG: tRNA (adenosine(37)-N6)-threonylcarbamoyltransferase complex ATPase subunit type 1 TsaE [Planctomycetota bacterium]
MTSPSEAEGAADLQFVTSGPEATRAAGVRLAAAALPLPKGGLLVALHGELGAGKTVFVQGVAAGLGIPPAAGVVSPTFTIARSYPAPDAVGVTLHHVDAYRLGGAEDLESAGFEDMCGDGCLTCVEWAERVEDALPVDRVDIWIAMESTTATVPEGEVPRLPRRLRLRAGGPSARAWLARFEAARSLGEGA